MSQKRYQKPAIGALPRGIDPGLARFLTAVKEAIEVSASQRGNPLDASPSFRDMVDAGIFKIKDGISIGGRAYSKDEIIGLVDFSLPDWITSDTAPQAPTGLQVIASKVDTRLTWDPSPFNNYGGTEVWRAKSNNISVAVRFQTVVGTEFKTAPPDPGEVFYYWIRHASLAGVRGPFNDVNGTATSAQPATMTVSSSFVGPDVMLQWPTPTSNYQISYYEIQYLNGTWLHYEATASNAMRRKPDWVGARSFRARAHDIYGNKGEWFEFTVTVVAPAAVVITTSFDEDDLVATWPVPDSSLPIIRYEVYEDSVAPGNLLETLYSSVYRNKMKGASKTLLVRAIDSSENPGTAGSATVTVSPGTIDTLTAEVIDNYVLLRWTSSKGSLRTRTFELRRGATWETADKVGEKSGLFTTVFESPQTPTSYTYWFATIDSGDNYGTPRSVTTTVSQPPDYLFAVNWISDFSGTKSNARAEKDYLVIPVNTSQTWAQHFTTNSWTTPKNQIDAGYPKFIQPGATTGYYEETFDYGTTLASMKISVIFSLLTVAGSLSSSVKITVAQDSGFTTGVQEFDGTQQAFALNFRYVKVRITVTATDDKGVGMIVDFAVKLDAKLRRESHYVEMTLGGAMAQGNLLTGTDETWSAGMTLPNSGTGLRFLTSGSGVSHSMALTTGPSGEQVVAYRSQATNPGASSSTRYYVNEKVTGLDPALGLLLANLIRVDEVSTSEASYARRSNDSTLLTLAGGGLSGAAWKYALTTFPAGEWRLMVDYIHPHDTAAATSDIAGRYDMAGVREAAYQEGKWPNGSGLKEALFEVRIVNDNAATGTRDVWQSRPVAIVCDPADAPALIQYLIKCATDWGASVEFEHDFVNVRTIVPGAPGIVEATVVPDFRSVANPERFNLFRFEGGVRVPGAASAHVEGY